MVHNLSRGNMWLQTGIIHQRKTPTYWFVGIKCWYICLCASAKIHRPYSNGCACGHRTMKLHTFVIGRQWSIANARQNLYIIIKVQKQQLMLFCIDCGTCVYSPFMQTYIHTYVLATVSIVSDGIHTHSHHAHTRTSVYS